MINNKTLVSSLNKFLSRYHFIKRSISWYFDEGTIIKVVNLQKSQYGSLYYVNLSIYLKDLNGDVKFPKEDECHIRTRMNNKFVNTPIDYNYLFDLEKVDISEEKFEDMLKQCVTINIIPQLDLIKSKDGLLKIAQTNPAIINMVPLNVKAYLGI